MQVICSLFAGAMGPLFLFAVQATHAETSPSYTCKGDQSNRSHSSPCE